LPSSAFKFRAVWASMLEISSETNTWIQQNERVDGKEGQFSTKTLLRSGRIPCQHFVNQKKLNYIGLFRNFKLGVYNGKFEYFSILFF